ncbi:hypothetical protein E2C01_024266 [Portunus trituberculatus]|uniref:Uncharacterized protein n=1 Tax=Portunus trituberculatus TaxID=210409 RepID=A0A5B7EE47_PORTR|nr:hypothetical protein [Portunus trituberculatus]
MCRVFSGFVCFDDLRFDASRKVACCCCFGTPCRLLTCLEGPRPGGGGNTQRRRDYHVRVSAGIVSGVE